MIFELLPLYTCVWGQLQWNPTSLTDLFHDLYVNSGKIWWVDHISEIQKLVGNVRLKASTMVEYHIWAD